MWSTLLAFVLASAQISNALLRFPCSQYTVMRADPYALSLFGYRYD